MICEVCRKKFESGFEGEDEELGICKECEKLEDDMVIHHQDYLVGLKLRGIK